MRVRTRTLERYLARQIYAAVAFVLFAFLSLFAFFDLIRELADLGKVEYNLRQVFTFVLLSMPTHAYELLPVVVLIGTLYVLAHLASNSEYTVMRASGLSPRRAGLILGRIGLVFVVLTFVVGEWVSPWAEEAAQKVKLRAMSSMIGQDLQSGLWFKDEGSFINVREARQTNQLAGVRIYDFDAEYRLRQITLAERAEYAGKGVWRLHETMQTQFTPEGPRTKKSAETEWHSRVSPDMLDALIVKPERMSAWALHKYTEHLQGNRQRTERYEIALWKKLFYPAAALVMMALALPFAYMQARAGMVGVKVFRHHDRHLLPHDEQPVLAHRPAAELAAALRRDPAERRLPYRGDPDDVVGREKVSEVSTPGLLRRLASMGYEAVLLFAVAFFATWVFFFVSGGQDATAGRLRYVLQLFIFMVIAAYFLWCWLRGGQTLAMKAWHIRVVEITPAKALVRLLLATLLFPVSIVWALFDRERQFLHDRLTGTRLVDVPR